MYVPKMIIAKRLSKKMFNCLGMDVQRLSKCPKSNLLGLRGLSTKTIIDVGANEGQFAKEISKFFPDATLYCFEPLSDPFKELSEWAGKQAGRVKVLNVALGSDEGEVEMIEHIDHNTSSSLLQTTDICKDMYPFTERQSSVSVGLTTLDKAVAGLPEPIIPDLIIKLDVQGYEDRVIRGGVETFRKAKACIIEIIFDRFYEKQATFKDLLFLLDKLGYGYAGNLDQNYARDGHVIYIDAVFVRRG